MPRSVRNTALSTMKPTTRDRKNTKVLSTPWMRVRVTMSPLATWVISWPSTASTSSRLIDSSKPVETATSAEFLNAPVAKAFGAPSYTATSGMPMFALSARRRTVATSHCSCAPSGSFMTCAPVDYSAICLDMRSDMKEPPKPISSENQSSDWRSRPFCVRNRSTPSTLAMTESSSTTARLVARKSRMRFMFSVSASIGKLAATWGSEPGNSSVRPLDQASDCIPFRLESGRQAQGRATKARRREVPPSWSCAAHKGRCGLALGFGLLAFGLGLGLFLAFRLGGLLALRLGCRRGRGLRGCRRRGWRLRCDVESRAGEGGDHQDCDQFFHLKPRQELMSIAADTYPINASMTPALTRCPKMHCHCRPQATARVPSYNS